MNFFSELAKELLGEVYDDLPTIKGKPVYSLKECLTLMDMKDVKLIYMDLIEEKKFKKSKEQVIDEICEKLPDLFVETLSMGIISNVDSFIESSGIPNLVMISLGFQFGFEYKNKKFYIVPNELKEVYKICGKKNGSIASQLFLNKLILYMNINGIVRQDLINDIIKYYNIKVDMKYVNKLLKDNDIHVIFDNYYIYVPNVNEEIENKLKDLLVKKEALTYKLLSMDEILEYSEFIEDVNINLNDSLGTNNFDYVSLFATGYDKKDEFIDLLCNSLKLSKKKRKVLNDIIDEKRNEIRYWEFNGRNYFEYEQEMVVKNMLLLEKPKDSSLKTCISSLSKESLNLLFKIYHTRNIDKLAKEIIFGFEEYVTCYDIPGYNSVNACNNKVLTDYSLSYEIENGYIFAYIDKGKIKTLIPKEIKKILNNTDILDNFDMSFLDDIDI